MKLFSFLLLLSLSGKVLSDNGTAYRFYVVDPKTECVKICQTPFGIKASVLPTMVMNGGMFDPDYRAHGLLVCNHKIYKQLDTRKSKNANFYVRPNGVFLVDTGRFSVVTTDQYHRLYSVQIPEFATQSGPMLVINGTINPAFNMRSEYTNTRNGVGILPDGNPVFVLAEGITFYDFASIFKNTFHCKNALFLDGGLSVMLTGEQVKWITGQQLGPVIAIYKK